MSASPEISLPRFEGPLDLLLTLVRKNEVEITDIPIAEITRQYLNYLHRAEELNIDLGADFVYIAALLIHIKSRSLLLPAPTPPTPKPTPARSSSSSSSTTINSARGPSFSGRSWRSPGPFGPSLRASSCPNSPRTPSRIARH